MMNQTDAARVLLNSTARANFGERAGFGNMIRQGDNLQSRKYGISGWFMRPLYVSPDIVFCECYIDNLARWVGCPNPPSAYVVKNGDKIRRFWDYGHALRYAALQVIRRGIGK